MAFTFTQVGLIQKCMLFSVLFASVSAFITTSSQIINPFYSQIQSCRGHSIKMQSTTEFNLMSLNTIKKIILNVQDVDKALSFYTSGLGMKDLGEGSVGFSDDCVLTFQKADAMEAGEHFKALGISVPDVEAAVKELVGVGGEVVSEPEEIVFGPSIIPDEPVEFKDPKTMALIKDPNGVPLELTQAPTAAVNKARLMVTNLEKNVEFFEAMGMKLLRKRSLLPRIPTLTGFVGYGSEDDTMLELVYEYGVDKLAEGTLFGGIEVSTLDVAKGVEALEAAGIKPVKSSSSAEAILAGPDGHSIKLKE